MEKSWGEGWLKMESNINQKIRNFYKRWNMPYDEKKQFEEFKNRVLHSFDLVLGRVFLENPELEEHYIKLTGLLPKHTFSIVHKGGIQNFSWLLSGYSIKFNDTRIWDIISNLNDFLDLIKCIQSVFWLDINKDIKDKFFESIKEDIKLSGIQVNIKNTGQKIILYPKGVKLLDEKTINDVLNWLSSYPRVQKSFGSALEKYMSKHYKRNIIDDLRVSLELLLRIILKNRKRLEKQTSPLGKFLKSKKVPREIRNMYTTLLDYYSKYQNEYAKHDDKVDNRELEFTIYLTGTLMRFLLNLGDSK